MAGSCYPVNLIPHIVPHSAQPANWHCCC